jgi:putative ATP-binding cassette transporter
LGAVWRLAAPYFASVEKAPVRTGLFGTWRVEERWLGCALLAAVIAAECAQVGLTVYFNQWNAVFFDALQNKDLAVFWQQLIAFAFIAAAFVIIAAYQLYLNQWLQIRWRRWLTDKYLTSWLADGTHYRMRLSGDPADNPDQRIADDISMFVDQTLSLGVGLLSATMTLASFSVVLWGISSQVPLSLGGHELTIPGYLVWLALGFSLVATVGAHLIGRALIDLNRNQQRFGADFCFALVRLRENSEQVAMLRGEAAEHRQLGARFANIVSNWHAVMNRQKMLTFFTAGYNQIAVILPYAILARPFFTSQIPLGTLMQTAGAFGQVQTSLSFFVTSYSRLAEWKAVVDRLSEFEMQTRLSHEAATHTGARLGSGRLGTPLCLADVHVATPEGKPLLNATYFTVEPGKALLLKGSSGCGKSTLLRTICGFWPHSRGRVLLAPGARVLASPQRPYLPLGSLRAVLAYPAAEQAVADEMLHGVLAKVGLGDLANSLDRFAAWSDILSLGEQQRIGFARALLTRADVLLLDESTSALDEPSEAALFRVLRGELPDAAVISIGHRSALAALHHRTIDLDRRLTLAHSA